jgi:predicted DNA-binding protein (UPF0251 family)
MIVTDELEAFRLGAISTLLASEAEAILQESRESLDAEKQETRARNVEACDSAVHMGFSRARRHF